MIQLDHFDHSRFLPNSFEMADMIVIQLRAELLKTFLLIEQEELAAIQFYPWLKRIFFEKQLFFADREIMALTAV